ncbi:MAG: hypothetical protein WAO95_10075 [Burkholderiales bacterium]
MVRAQLFLAALALAAALPPAAAQDPEAAYASFHRALVGGNLEGVLQNSPDAHRSQMAGLSPEQKAGWLQSMAARVPPSYTLRAKNVNPDGQGAQLYVSGPGKSLVGGKPETLYGIAQMVQQRGEWKVASIEWNNQDMGIPEQARPKAAGPYAPGAPAKPDAQPAPQAAPAAAPTSTAAQKAARSTPVVGSMDSAPERKLGTQKPPCVYKPVMTAEDLENCR